MTVLSDKHILELIDTKVLSIKPFDRQKVSGSSVDLTLSDEFLIFKHSELKAIDPLEKHNYDITDKIKVKKGKPFILHPSEFVLGSTVESVKIPADITARLDGKSSLGRLGVIVHSTAGSVDAGFQGTLTLEITNISRLPVLLWPGMDVCRLTFELMTSPALRPYHKKKSKYKAQRGPSI